jgi:hypothetical protein
MLGPGKLRPRLSLNYPASGIKKLDDRAMAANRRLMLPNGARKGGPYLHEEFNSLPSDVRAADPQEVEIVILCFPRVRASGKYMGGDEGYRITTNLYCFDADTGDFKGYKKVKGESPPSEAKSGSSKEERTGKSNIVEAVVELVK